MRFLKATTDIAFKKLFGDQKRADLTISFLNSVLERKEGEKITSVMINDPANHPATVDKKSSFVDVSCTDQSGKKYIIEIQVIDEKNFIERAQYYKESLEEAARMNERKTITKNLIDAGLDILFIAQVTGFTFEEIENVQREKVLLSQVFNPDTSST